MQSSNAEMWMEKQPFMNSYSVVAQTMTFWLSCFPWVCTPGTCSSVCWSTRCVWGSEASARGWLVEFVSMNWPSAYASQSMRQLGQQCSRSHIHRLSKCLLICVCAFCLQAAVSIFQEAVDVKAWLFPFASARGARPRNTAVLVCLLLRGGLSAFLFAFVSRPIKASPMASRWFTCKGHGQNYLPLHWEWPLDSIYPLDLGPILVSASVAGNIFHLVVCHLFCN